MKPITRLPETTKLGAILAEAPTTQVSITNEATQDSILAVVDEVNARRGIDRFIDGYCAFGARLSRYYLSKKAVVGVSFQWDHQPKITTISYHGTNISAAQSWEAELTEALATELSRDR